MMENKGNHNSDIERSGGGGHLTIDELNALFDRRFDGDEEQALRAHLASCAACTEEFESLQATVVLMKSLPMARPARSFQLSPEMAAGKQSVWSRWAGKLFPAIPALRTATVAIAILLIVVGAGDIFRDKNGDGNNVLVSDVPTIAMTSVATEPPGESARSAAQAEVAATEPPSAPPAEPGIVGSTDSEGTDGATEAQGFNAVEGEDGENADQAAATQGDTTESVDTGAVEAAAPASGEGAGAAAKSTADEDADSAGQDSIAMSVLDEGGVAAEAPASPTAAPTSTSTATATPTLTPTLEPTPVPSPTITPTVVVTETKDGDSGDSWTSGWRIAELLLAIVLAGMVGLLLFLQRSRIQS